MTPMDRRDFVKTAATAGAGFAALGFPNVARARNLNDAVSVAVMGVNSRGSALAESFALATGSDVLAICDLPPGLCGAAGSARGSVGVGRDLRSPGRGRLGGIRCAGVNAWAFSPTWRAPGRFPLRTRRCAPTRPRRRLAHRGSACR